MTKSNRICSVEGCGNKLRALNLCNSHYLRFKRHGDPLGGRHTEVNKGKICLAKNCNKPSASKGHCTNHYALLKRHGDANWIITRTTKEQTEKFIQSALESNSDKCILWPYGKSEGYGNVSRNGMSVRVHRLVCIKAHGTPPIDKNEAAHFCGVRSCINPRHLRWSTHKDNLDDRVQHGTDCRGQKHTSSVLTECAVIEMRMDKEKSHKHFAKKFGVGLSTVAHARQGKSWKWLKLD